MSERQFDGQSMPVGGQNLGGRVLGRRRPGRPRQVSEAQILEAAEAVFAEAGFRGATMQAIADRAGLPKANLHYYFRNKAGLYRALLAGILDLWLGGLDHIRLDADPAQALAAYIAVKMRWSFDRPLASKVFANELIHGGRHIDAYLNGKLREVVDAKAAVIEGWIAAGRMAPVDPRHLLFTLWAATQTYADFGVQVRAVLAVPAVDGLTMEHATTELTRLVLRGCGLEVNSAIMG